MSKLTVIIGQTKTGRTTLAAGLANFRKGMHAPKIKWLDKNISSEELLKKLTAESCTIDKVIIDDANSRSIPALIELSKIAKKTGVEIIMVLQQHRHELVEVRNASPYREPDMVITTSRIANVYSWTYLKG